MNKDYITAHTNSVYHRKEILSSDTCGCFYCLKIFGADEIKEWIDDNDTALCPYCSIDAVIGSASGYDIQIDFLRKMRKHWF